MGDYGMQIVLMRKNEITKTVLPKKVSGQHFVHYTEKNRNTKPLLAVTAVEGKWVVKKTKLKEFLDFEGIEL